MFCCPNLKIFLYAPCYGEVWSLSLSIIFTKQKLCYYTIKVFSTRNIVLHIITIDFELTKHVNLVLLFPTLDRLLPPKSVLLQKERCSTPEMGLLVKIVRSSILSVMQHSEYGSALTTMESAQENLLYHYRACLWNPLF